MVTKITSGVNVTVETKYNESYSDPDSEDFAFAYNVTIENRNDYAVQLVRRHWF